MNTHSTKFPTTTTSMLYLFVFFINKKEFFLLLGRKLGAPPLFGEGAGSPSNTVVWAEVQVYICTSAKEDVTVVVCLEGKGENYQVCSVQYCVQQLCTV